MTHEDECDATTYESGACTCDMIREYGTFDSCYSEPSASSMIAMEDYSGPALDW